MAVSKMGKESTAYLLDQSKDDMMIRDNDKLVIRNLGQGSITSDFLQESYESSIVNSNFVSSREINSSSANEDLTRNLGTNGHLRNSFDASRENDNNIERDNPLFSSVLLQKSDKNMR